MQIKLQTDENTFLTKSYFPVCYKIKFSAQEFLEAFGK